MERLRRSHFIILFTLAVYAIQAPSLVTAVELPQAPSKPTAPPQKGNLHTVDFGSTPSSSTPAVPPAEEHVYPIDSGLSLSSSTSTKPHLCSNELPFLDELLQHELDQQRPRKNTAKQVIKALLEEEVALSGWRKLCATYNEEGRQALYETYSVFQDYLPLVRTKPSRLQKFKVRFQSIDSVFRKNPNSLKLLKDHLQYAYRNGVFSIGLQALKGKWRYDTPSIRLQRKMDPPETFYEILNAANLLLANFFLFESDGEEHVTTVLFSLEAVESYLSRLIKIAYQSESAYNPFEIKNWHELFERRLDAMSWILFPNERKPKDGEDEETAIKYVGDWISKEYNRRGAGKTSELDRYWVLPDVSD